MGPSAFTMLRRLGTGAAGEVWLAEGVTGLVAVKMASPGRSLRAEMAALSQVKHPHVPGLVDFDPKGTWLVREYAEGQRLTSWAHERTLDEIVHTFGLLCRAVQAIHDAGVVHGDLSPANVLVATDGTPFVLDLGADVRGPAGALGWMAPERLRGENGNIASDVYSLGALLYAMATGRPPYDRGGGAQVGWAAATTLPLPPSSLRAPMPVGLDELVLECLAFSPRVRPLSAATLAARIGPAVQTPVARPIVGLTDERERLRRGVVDARRGEGGLFIVHGPPGCGRRTLLAEAARAARREGLPVVEANLSEVSAAVLASRDAGVLMLDADSESPATITEALDRPTDAALVVVRSRFPVPALIRRGATHLTPTLLTASDVALVLRALGQDESRVAEIMLRSRGQPGAVAALTGKCLPKQPSAVEQRVLAAIGVGPALLLSVAEAAKLGEHAVLDVLEPWFALGAAWSSPDGAQLYTDPSAIKPR